MTFNWLLQQLELSRKLKSSTKSTKYIYLQYMQNPDLL